MLEKGVHGCFEKFVQVICSLHQFEGNADQEQLLELLSSESTGPESNDKCCNKAAAGDNNVEYIPAICTETAPTQSKEANYNIDHVDKGDQEEKIIWRIN